MTGLSLYDRREEETMTSNSIFDKQEQETMTSKSLANMREEQTMTSMSLGTDQEQVLLNTTSLLSMLMSISGWAWFLWLVFLGLRWLRNFQLQVTLLCQNSYSEVESWYNFELQDTIETDECLEIFRLACLSVLQSCLPFPSSRRILLLLTRVLLWFVSIADQRFKEASIRWESVVASVLCSFDGQCNTGSKCWERSESTWQWVWWSGLKPQVWLQTEFTYREVFRTWG